MSGTALSDAASSGAIADNGHTIAAHAILAALGSETAVLDVAAFERTATFLAPEEVAAYLRTIAERSEALPHRLHAPNAFAGMPGDLAGAAHTLARSAGMFGFKRITTLARRFELAVEAGAPDTRALADGLAAAIEASLQQISDRVRGGAQAVSTPEDGGVIKASVATGADRAGTAHHLVTLHS